MGLFEDAPDSEVRKFEPLIHPFPTSKSRYASLYRDLVESLAKTSLAIKSCRWPRARSSKFLAKEQLGLPEMDLIPLPLREFAQEVDKGLGEAPTWAYYPCVVALEWGSQVVKLRTSSKIDKNSPNLPF